MLQEKARSQSRIFGFELHLSAKVCKGCMCTWICTSLSSEEVEDPAGLAPAELVPRLHQALVLGVLPQAPDLVALPVAAKKAQQIS